MNQIAKKTIWIFFVLILTFPSIADAFSTEATSVELNIQKANKITFARTGQWLGGAATAFMLHEAAHLPSPPYPLSSLPYETEGSQAALHHLL